MQQLNYDFSKPPEEIAKLVDAKPEVVSHSQAEATASAAQRLQKEKEIYKFNRMIKLAPLDGDGMDAIRKAIDSLAQYLVVDLPEEYIEYRDKVLDIKAENPKPSEN